ncbi:MAG: leucine-rich repeat domain-containing protein [Mogibacterium sp.]|nr:leucine-rich repeat domain-containing protein [Mogibacterium sp.]
MGDQVVFTEYNGTEERFVMPDDVTEVAEGAFAKNKSLRHVDLRNVRRIGTSAFQDCSNLESVVMSKVTVIDPLAFEFCRSLRTVVIGDITDVGERAFFCCSLLDIPQLPRSIRSVGSGAFSHTSIRRADLHWLSEIPSYLFSSCNALAYADISGAREIGAEAFSGCGALTRVLYDAAEKIGAKAFYRCDAFIVSRLPDGLREIGDDAFSSIQNGLTVPGNVEAIGRNCFGPADRKKSIRIYRPALYELRNYFKDDRTDPEYEDDHFYLWESSIDITVLDEQTDEVIGLLPLYSDFDPYLRSALAEAFREDNTFDYTILDTVIFDGMKWNQRCKDKQAVTRIKFPYGLSDTAREQYDGYLHRHFGRMAQRALRDRDIDMLAFMCEHDLIGEENITEIIDSSISLAAPECTAFLLERQAESGWHGDPLLDEL